MAQNFQEQIWVQSRPLESNDAKCVVFRITQFDSTRRDSTAYELLPLLVG